MLKRLLKNEKGLTLIELLAVVVILGIIAAIAVPAIGNIIDNTREDATVSDALQIISAAKIAKAQNTQATKFGFGEVTTSTDHEVDLTEFLDSKIEGSGTPIVTYDGEWKIKDHEAIDVLKKNDEIDDSVDEATEEELTGFLDR